MHTVRCLEEAGAACIQIEDQQFPEEMRSPQRQAAGPGRRHVPQGRGRRSGRVRSADLRPHRCGRDLARRRDRARQPLCRGRRRPHLRRGAHLAPTHIRRVRAEVKAPLLANMTEFGRTPQLSLQRMDAARLRGRDLSGVGVPHRGARDRALLREPAGATAMRGVAARDDDAGGALRHASAITTTRRSMRRSRATVPRRHIPRTGPGREEGLDGRTCRVRTTSTRARSPSSSPALTLRADSRRGARAHQAADPRFARLRDLRRRSRMVPHPARDAARRSTRRARRRSGAPSSASVVAARGAGQRHAGAGLRARRRASPGRAACRRRDAAGAVRGAPRATPS